MRTTKQPLPEPIRRRVLIAVALSAVLFLILVPLAVYVLFLSDVPGSTGDTINALFLLAVPFLGFAAAWNLARRGRADPQRLLRRPNAKARRLIAIGRWVGLAVGVVVVVATDGGRIRLVLGWLAFTIVFCGFFTQAQRKDPRLHWFRSMDAGPAPGDGAAHTDSR